MEAVVENGNIQEFFPLVVVEEVLVVEKEFVVEDELVVEAEFVVEDELVVEEEFVVEN